MTRIPFDPICRCARPLRFLSQAGSFCCHGCGGFLEATGSILLSSVAQQPSLESGALSADPHGPEPLPSAGIPENADLVDVEQASAITSIPKRTLDNWRGKHAQRNGKGPPFVKLGRGRNALVRYRRKDLEDWVRAHLVKRG